MAWIREWQGWVSNGLVFVTKIWIWMARIRDDSTVQELPLPWCINFFF